MDFHKLAMRAKAQGEEIHMGAIAMQHDAHVWRMRRWQNGRRLIHSLPDVLPQDRLLTNNDITAFLKMMESVVRFTYEVPGRIKIN